MILLRQKLYTGLQPGAKRIRDFWYKAGLRLQPILKKSEYQVKESANRVGLKANKLITRPLAVGSDAAVNFVSRPLETAGMPLLVAPELISTGVGGAMVLAGKGLRKIKPIGRLSDNFARKLRNTRLYQRAQNSTRGFHNNFELPKYVTYGGLGVAAAGTTGLVIRRKRKKRAKKAEAALPNTLA